MVDVPLMRALFRAMVFARRILRMELTRVVLPTPGPPPARNRSEDWQFSAQRGGAPLPTRAALLLVGDVDQLPSVGPGQVLADIIASGAVHGDRQAQRGHERLRRPTPSLVVERTGSGEIAPSPRTSRTLPAPRRPSLPSPPSSSPSGGSPGHRLLSQALTPPQNAVSNMAPLQRWVLLPGRTQRTQRQVTRGGPQEPS
jgi:hypothetical protein